MERSHASRKVYASVPHARSRMSSSGRSTISPLDDQWDYELAIDANALVTPALTPPDFLLKASVKDDDIKVVVDFGAFGFSKPDEFQLYIGDRNNPVGAMVALDDDMVAAGKVELTLPANARKAAGQGRQTLFYGVTYKSGVDGNGWGPEQFYTLDTVAPGADSFLGELEFDPGVRDEGVTADKLVTENGATFLKAYVPSYNTPATGDVFTAMIDNAKQDVIAIDLADGRKEIHFDITFIEAQEDGPHDFLYMITDRAGNASKPAAAVRLQVLVKGAIGTPGEPGVPAYDDDDDSTDPKLIDEADARNPAGLAVVIPANSELLKDDTIDVLWGGSAKVGPVAVTNPAASTTVYVPYPAILAEWNGTAAGGDTVVDVAVSYEVRRGGLLAGTSAPHPVKVNLYSAGGVDPDPETPEHGNLVLPTLMSDSATGSGDANKIPVEDFDKPATVTVPWFRTDGTTAVFALDDILIVNYAGQDMNDRVIAQPDVDAEADIDVTLPVAAIDAGGSGPAIPLLYKVRRKLAAGGANDALSPTQPVEVHGTDEEPGGGDPLDACDAPEALGGDPKDPARRIISPVQAKDGVDFIIPEYKNQKRTDLVTLKFKIFAGFYGVAHPTDPAPLYPRDFTVPVSQATLDQPLSINAPESSLMGDPTKKQPLHAHVSYSVQARTDTGTPVGREVEAGSLYIVDIEPRG
ncbi:hypothetical protein [Luteibacter sp. 3190]|uniref:hypothetical protein n=1 Tax=Luteibacter sp. 3190 TaxID=2817736 RepID=UPI00285F0757|nr:hypothetical protein [Luteibacter sp. 3190]MDR6935572.1 hypothetical protein [Luteibacter sp. 3190]